MFYCCYIKYLTVFNLLLKFPLWYLINVLLLYFFIIPNGLWKASANYVHDRMKQVQLDHINKIAPYKVKVEGKQSAQPDRFTIRSASTTIEGQGFYAAIIVENRNPLLTNITADFDKTAVTLTNKPGE